MKQLRGPSLTWHQPPVGKQLSRRGGWDADAQAEDAFFLLDLLATQEPGVGRKGVRAVRVEQGRQPPCPQNECSPRSGMWSSASLHVFWLKNKIHEAGKQEEEGRTGTKCRIHRIWWHALVNSALRRLSRRSKSLGLGQRETLSQKATSQPMGWRESGRRRSQAGSRGYTVGGSLQTETPPVSPAAPPTPPALTGFCNC